MEFKIPLPGLLKGNTGSQTLDYGLLPECFRKTLGKITNGAMQTFSHIMCISCVRPVMFAGLLLEQSNMGGFASFIFPPAPLPSHYFIIIDRFYIALFSALEQTHCARM